MDKAVIQTGLTYGIACALIGFGGILIMYFTGLNPFGSNLALTVILLPVVIFFGLSQFKKYIDPNIGFLKAFRVALLITVSAAVMSALLILGLGYVGGDAAIQRHIVEMKAVLEEPTAKAKTIEIAGRANYEKALKDLESIRPLDLAADDFFKKLGIGFLLSIVAATFFRK